MPDALRVPVGPGALHVERFGFGDRQLVLLHGFGTSSFLWRDVAPRLHLGAVSAYAIDLLGWGESDQLSNANYGIGAQAEYLDTALTALRIARADFVAVDFSSAVILALAARRPARVRSVVLINPGDPAHPRGADFDEFERSAARSFLDASIAMTGSALLLGPILERSVARPERMPRSLVGRYAAPFVGREGFRHLSEVQRAINDRGLDGVRWETIGAPVLVLRGDADTWITPGVAAGLAARLRNGEVRRVGGAARLIPEDDPAGLAEILTGWTAPDAPGRRRP